MLPDIIIVGAQKAGTTSMLHYLSQHPDVYMHPKEIHFFDFEENFKQGEEWYSSHFKDAKNSQLIGEKTPEYMYLEEMPSRIAQYTPKAKLIFMLRNPVDRTWSHYWHEKKKCREDKDFMDALLAEEERITLGHEQKQNFSYKDRGKYIVQIENFLKHFPKEQMCFVLTEELAENPLDVLHNVLTFLDLDDSCLSNFQVEKRNQGKTPRSQLLARIRFNSFVSRIPLLRGVLDLINLKSSPNSMSKKDRAYLHDYFSDYNVRLGEFTDLNLDKWRRK